jgi:Flp pilus assembly protein TadG
MVEMMVAFLVFIVMIFGVIESALFFQDHETLYNITREAARRLTVGDTAGSSGTAETKALKWNMANPNFTSSTVNFTFEQSKDASTWTPLANNAQATMGYWVRVKTTYTHRNITRFFGTSYVLPATAVMRVEN